MHQSTRTKEYLDNLELRFPVAPNLTPRPGFRRTAEAVTDSSRSFRSSGTTLLAPPPPARTSRKHLSPEPQLNQVSLKGGKDQAMLVDKSLITFVSGLSAGNRADILESTLLAQFGAKSKVPDETDIIGWYKAYIEILSNIGWTVEGGDIQHFSARANIAEIQTVIIEILQAAFGVDFLQIVTKALEGIKSLADSNGKIKAFEKNTHMETNGSFQIGIATQEGGAPSIHLGTFLITTSNKIKHLLFIKFIKDETDLQYASSKLNLDQKIFGTVRNLVQQKLKGRIAEFVTEIPL